MMKSDWERTHNPTFLDSSDFVSVLKERTKADSIMLINEGCRNANYKIVRSGQTRLLRIGINQQNSVQTEAKLHTLVLSHGIPAPSIVGMGQVQWNQENLIYIEMRYFQGQTLQTFLRHHPFETALPYIEKAGKALANIHKITFDKVGFFDEELNIHPPPFFIEDYVEERLALCTEYLTPAQQDQILKRVKYLPSSSAALTHGDYDPANIFVSDNDIIILDWEFAHAGNKLQDLANMLRFEDQFLPEYRETFIKSYLKNGGNLPEGWESQMRDADLISLVEILSHCCPEAHPQKMKDVLSVIKKTLDPEMGQAAS